MGWVISRAYTVVFLKQADLIIVALLEYYGKSGKVE